MSADANADRRFSTETQRANGFRQSVLPGRAERIAEDIKNGNYSCAICLDRIEHIHEALWSCDQCHSVWHHRCIKPWSDRGRSSFFVGSWTWKCPTCAKRHHAIEGASCWCGKERAMERDPMADYPLNPATLQVHSGALIFSARQTRAGAIPVGSSAPNSCGKVCGRYVSLVLLQPSSLRQSSFSLHHPFRMYQSSATLQPSSSFYVNPYFNKGFRGLTI